MTKFDCCSDCGVGQGWCGEQEHHGRQYLEHVIPPSSFGSSSCLSHAAALTRTIISGDY
jgi:hypothetical protein